MIAATNLSGANHNTTGNNHFFSGDFEATTAQTYISGNIYFIPTIAIFGFIV